MEAIHSPSDIIVKQKISEKIIFKIRKDGIFCTEVLPNTVMGIEDGENCTKITNELQGNVAHPLLCDLSNVIKMTKDCREHFSGEVHSETFTVAALLVTNPISKIIGNFFMGLNKPIKKTRLFTNRERAIEWLNMNR